MVKTALASRTSTSPRRSVGIICKQIEQACSYTPKFMSELKSVNFSIGAILLVRKIRNYLLTKTYFCNNCERINKYHHAREE